jgi:heat shock protein HtpX
LLGFSNLDAVNMKTSFYDEISRNKRDSILMAIVVFSLLAAIIYLVSIILVPEFSIMAIAFGSAMIIIYVYGTYSYGDRIVLAATKAKEIDYDDRKYAHLVNAVDGLSIAAGIPRPKIYVVESGEINAFATGKDPQHASVAVTTGLLENLKRDEIEGVIGHELSHIRNYDIRFALVVAVMVGIIAILSYMFRNALWAQSSGRRSKDEGGAGLIIIIGLMLAIFAPIAVRLVQLAISRRREFLADSSSVELTRYPEGLADALEKIKDVNEGKMKVSEAVSHLFFTDPNKSPLDSLFATHPPIEERIRILRSMQ